MANTKEIKRRIWSIENTGKITKAMELISTIKMKKAQDLATEKKNYIKSLYEVFLNVSSAFSESRLFNIEKSGNPKTLWVLITSNKWLCGWYNINAMKEVSNYMKQNDWDIDFIAVGTKWAQFIARTWNTLISDMSANFSDDIDLGFTKSISRLILKEYLEWKYDRVVIFYNHFQNTITQVPISMDFMPITLENIEDYFSQVLGDDYESMSNIKKNVDYIIEPSKKIILDELLPMMIDNMFLDIVLEAKASEHSARMIAMKNAKDNAKKYREELTLRYNKARQAAITTEISEIVSWVESLKDTF